VGVAMTAAVGLGIYKDFDSLKKVVAVDRVFVPQDKNREVYDFLYCSYKDLYKNLKQFYKNLNKQRCDTIK
jgi:autoinducer 2 (AI-2) kinase